MTEKFGGRMHRFVGVFPSVHVHTRRNGRLSLRNHDWLSPPLREVSRSSGYGAWLSRSASEMKLCCFGVGCFDPSSTLALKQDFWQHLCICTTRLIDSSRQQQCWMRACLDATASTAQQKRLLYFFVFPFCLFLFSRPRRLFFHPFRRLERKSLHGIPIETLIEPLL